MPGTILLSQKTEGKDIDESAYEELQKMLAENKFTTSTGIIDDASKKVLARIDPTNVKDAQAIVFAGPATSETATQFYLAVDAAQSGLPAAYISDDPSDERLKPIVIFDPSAKSNWLLIKDRMQSHVETGLAKEDVFKTGIVRVAQTAEQVIDFIGIPIEKDRFKIKGSSPQELGISEGEAGKAIESVANKKVFVCCSFSTRNPLLEATAIELGRALAQNSFDLITGGGRSAKDKAGKDHGMMFHVQHGAADAKVKGAPGGHVTGITFASLNPLADYSGKRTEKFGIHRIKKSENIVDRIHQMVEGSKVVFIDSGGLGTDTEALAPVLIGNKPIVIRNMPKTDFDEATGKVTPAKEGGRIHDGLIEILKEIYGLKQGKDFFTVEPDLALKDGKIDIKKTAQNAAKLAVEALPGILRDYRREPALSRVA